MLKDGHGQYVFEPDPPKTPGSLTAAALQRYAEDSLKEGSEAPTTMFASPFISFDSKGVDFGPWLRRFVAQLKRNWYGVMPPTAMSLQGHVVLAFDVYKDGRLTNVELVTPSGVESFNEAVKKAAVLSNPTESLPADYPDEKARFTITFFYNERPPDTPATVSPQ